MVLSDSMNHIDEGFLDCCLVFFLGVVFGGWGSHVVNLKFTMYTLSNYGSEYLFYNIAMLVFDLIYIVYLFVQ